MKIPHHIHKFFVVKPEACKLLDMVDIRDLPDHLVIHAAKPVHPLLFLTGVFYPDDDFVSLFPFSHKNGYHLYRVLKIRAHTHHAVAVRLLHSINR